MGVNRVTGVNGLNKGHSFLSLSTSIRSINRARLISLIRQQPGLTRTDLSRLTGLSKGAISNHVAELLAEGLLYEKEGAADRQRNSALWLNRNAGFAVGIELAADECRGVLTDAEIRPLKQRQHRLNSTRVEESLEAIYALIVELLEDVEGPCLGVVIGVPGPTDEAGKAVMLSESLNWSNVPLVQRLSERLPYRMRLINRAQAAVWGEYWYGAGVGADDLIYVSISSGIAAGILIEGQLYTGARGVSGELGHTTILVDGMPCVCGNHGCLETVASVPTILQAIKARSPRMEQFGVHELINAARDGDAIVADELKKAGRYIGVAIANLIDLFNPSRVVIGGQLAEAGDIILNTIRETAQRRTFSLSFAGVQIVRNALGTNSVCIGACTLVVDQYVAEVEPALQLSI
jgi:predicted NBD/HSP70 family sugar kinase